MEPNSTAAVIAAVSAIVAAALAAWVTRRNAIDAQKRTDSVTAAGLYTQLAQDQRTDITDLRGQVTKLMARVTTLEATIIVLRRRARVHIVWDDELVAEVNKVPGVHVRPAPPLLDDDE